MRLTEVNKQERKKERMHLKEVNKQERKNERKKEIGNIYE